MTVQSFSESLIRYRQFGNAPMGRGGCGVVWRAHDLLFDRVVAIKTLNEMFLLKNDRAALRSFAAEAMAGARLGEKSLHIVKVYDFGCIDEYPFIAMEWIPSEAGSSPDLGSYIGRVSVGKCKEIAHQICDAVELAHQNGIVHSDIAPWNVLFDPRSNTYKVSDFGLLRIVEKTLIDAGSESLLKGGRRAFQPAEVLECIDNVSFGSDVYAIAVTCFLLLSGLTPLPGSYNSLRVPDVVRVKHTQSDAPPPLLQLFRRFIVDHTAADSIDDFRKMLQRVPS